MVNNENAKVALAVNDWLSVFKYNPIPNLLSSNNEAIKFFANRDLLGINKQKIEKIWNLPAAQSIINKQQDDGSWEYPGGNQKVRSAENYSQIETFRNLGYLIEMYGYDRSNSVIARAAEFLFKFQTTDGDIRGILGNQYTPYYTAAIAELLIKAGYSNDDRIKKIFTWLKSIRQNDGGWAIPLRTRDQKLDIIAMNSATLEPDKSRPFSHLVTGVVLRAYAAHEDYSKLEEAKVAGQLLKSNFFKKDNYVDRGDHDFWLRFTYPFWFTDLISAMDSLSKLEFSRDDPQIKKAINWFISNQQSDGSWKLKTLKNKSILQTDLWLDLAICRIIKRF